MEGSEIGVVAFAFGRPEKLLPNKIIAEIAVNQVQKFNAFGIYTQRDIPFKSVKPELKAKEVEVVYEEDINNYPPSTLRIAQGAVRWAKEHQLKKLMVVAAIPHLERALRDVKKAALKNKAQIEVNKVDELSEYPDDFWWFSPWSIQKWTTSRREWEKRERFLMSLPFCFYEILEEFFEKLRRRGFRIARAPS